MLAEVLSRISEHDREFLERDVLANDHAEDVQRGWIFICFIEVLRVGQHIGALPERIAQFHPPLRMIIVVAVHGGIETIDLFAT